MMAQQGPEARSTDEAKETNDSNQPAAIGTPSQTLSSADQSDILPPILRMPTEILTEIIRPLIPDTAFHLCGANCFHAKPDTGFENWPAVVRVCQRFHAISTHILSRETTIFLWVHNTYYEESCQVPWCVGGPFHCIRVSNEPEPDFSEGGAYYNAHIPVAAFDRFQMACIYVSPECDFVPHSLSCRFEKMVSKIESLVDVIDSSARLSRGAKPLVQLEVFFRLGEEYFWDDRGSLQDGLNAVEKALRPFRRLRGIKCVTLDTRITTDDRIGCGYWRQPKRAVELRAGEIKLLREAEEDMKSNTP